MTVPASSILHILEKVSVIFFWCLLECRQAAQLQAQSKEWLDFKYEVKQFKLKTLIDPKMIWKSESNDNELKYALNIDE